MSPDVHFLNVLFMQTLLLMGDRASGEIVSLDSSSCPAAAQPVHEVVYTGSWLL